MNESKSNVNGMIIFVVGTIGVIVLSIYIISSKNFPSFGEFMASTTSNGIGDSEKIEGSYATTTVRAPGGDIQVEIADTPTKRELGLSGRALLNSNTGMLFIFENPGSYFFWMKDMRFPIDIVWINVDREVVGIDSNISPDTYPKTFNSSEKVQFVLELNAGDASKFGIATGTTLKF